MKSWRIHFLVQAKGARKLGNFCLGGGGWAGGLIGRTEASEEGREK